MRTRKSEKDNVKQIERRERERRRETNVFSGKRIPWELGRAGKSWISSRGHAYGVRVYKDDRRRGEREADGEIMSKVRGVETVVADFYGFRAKPGLLGRFTACRKMNYSRETERRD